MVFAIIAWNPNRMESLKVDIVDYDPAKVLLISRRRWESALVGVLGGLGLEPLVCSSLAEAVDMTCPGRFAAVFIESSGRRIDPLELVLNLRDIDRDTPVVVIGKPRESNYEQKLREQGWIFRLSLLPEHKLASELKKMLASVLDIKERNPDGNRYA